MGEIGITVIVLVASVTNSSITPSSEYWTTIGVIADCFFLICECHFLFEVNRQQKTLPFVVSRVLSITIIPGEVIVSRDGLSKLSTDNGECSWKVVALFVEY